eukprot:COSAG05_NODE_2347_length_3196_cov_4.919277_2_plen_59_part_00
MCAPLQHRLVEAGINDAAAEVEISKAIVVRLACQRWPAKADNRSARRLRPLGVGFSHE